MPSIVLLLALGCAPDDTPAPVAAEVEERDEADCTPVDWGPDADGDGWAGNLTQSACEPPGEGWTTQLGDCDDADPNAHAEIWSFRDADRDGWGTAAHQELSCGLYSDLYVLASGDCDDLSPSVYPGAPEACEYDRIDENCDGTPTSYLDEDGDGYGTFEVVGCEVPRADASGDCDDADPSLSPGALEICGDDLDQDCDGNAGPCGVEGVWPLGEHVAVVEKGYAKGGDLDGDGAIDLLLHQYRGGMNAQLGPFDRSNSRADGEATLVVGVPRDGYPEAALADADGDGRDDVIVGIQDNGATTWIESSDKQGSLAQGTADVVLPGSYLALVIDSDGDDVDEIGVRWWPDSSTWGIAFVEGLPDGTWSAGDQRDAWLEGASAATDLGDVDGDGLSDLAWSMADGVRVAYGPLAGDIAADHVLAAPADGHLALKAYAAGDLDGDGLRDLAIHGRDLDRDCCGDTEYGAVQVHLAPFAADVESSDAKVETQDIGLVAEAGDLDGDGLGELFVNQYAYCWFATGRAWIFSGPWEGALSVSAPLATLEWSGEYDAARSVVAADLDGDGIGDLAVSSDYQSYLLFGGPGL